MILINQNQKVKFLILLIQLKKTDYNTKISEIEGKIPNITGLVTISALIAAENKIPSINKLVKKRIMMKKLEKLIKKLLIILLNLIN